MKYKMKSNGDEFILTVGPHKFVMHEPQDILRISLDSSEQIFTADITNPSQHTLYLLEEGMLGVTLCKVNTGASQRYHMVSTHGENDGDSVLTEANDYVKRHFHPRWSRCNTTVFSIDSLTNLEIPISDFQGQCHAFKPNQAHSIKNKRYWCTKIKAILVNLGNGDRAYKSYSNRVPIIYDAGRDMILNRGEPVAGGGGGNSGFRVEQLSSNTFRVTFSNLSDFWLGQTVEILMSTKDISNMHRRTWYQDHYDYDGNPRQHSVHSFVQYHSNKNSILATIDIDSNNTYVDVTIPDLSHIDMESPYIHRRVYHAYTRAQDNDFREGNFYYNSNVYIQVRKYKHDTKMICLNGTGKTVYYDTGFRININTNI